MRSKSKRIGMGFDEISMCIEALEMYHHRKLATSAEYYDNGLAQKNKELRRRLEHHLNTVDVEEKVEERKNK